MDFYSSREERLKVASSSTRRAYEKRNSKSFLKRNPQLKILIIDLFIVLLFGVIIVPFFMKITKDIRVDDYKISSKAVYFDSNILVSLKVSKTFKQVKKRLSNDELKVDIIFNTSIIDSKTVRLPATAAQDEFVFFKLDNGSEMDKVEINLTSGDFLKNYSVNIEH